MSNQRHSSVSSSVSFAKIVSGDSSNSLQVETDEQQKEQTKSSGSLKGTEDWPTLDGATLEENNPKSMIGKTNKEKIQKNAADPEKNLDIEISQEDGELSHLLETSATNGQSGGNRKAPKTCWKKVNIDLEYNSSREMPKRRVHRRIEVEKRDRSDMPKVSAERRERENEESGTRGDEARQTKATAQEETKAKVGPNENDIKTDTDQQQQPRDYWYFDDTSNGYYYQHSGSQGWKKNKNDTINSSKTVQQNHHQPQSQQQHRNVGHHQQSQSTAKTAQHSPVNAEERVTSTSPRSEESSSNMATTNTRIAAQRQFPSASAAPRSQHYNGNCNWRSTGRNIGGGRGGGTFRGRRFTMDAQSQHQHQQTKSSATNTANFRPFRRRPRRPLPDWDKVQEVADDCFDYVDLMESQYSQYYALSSVPPFDHSLGVGIIATANDVNAAVASSTTAFPNYIQQLQSRMALTTFHHPSGYLIAQSPPALQVAATAAASIHHQQQQTSSAPVLPHNQQAELSVASRPESAATLATQPLNISAAHPYAAIVPSVAVTTAHANVVSASVVPPASLLSPTGLISFPLASPVALPPNAVVFATADQLPSTTAAAEFTPAVLAAQFPPNALFAAHPPTTATYIDEMKLKDLVRTQIEYYLSADNLQKDFFLRRKMDHEGFLPLTLVAGFPRVRSLALDQNFIISSLCDSEKVELNEDHQKIRPRMNPQQWPLVESATHTEAENSPTTTVTGAVENAVEETEENGLETEMVQQQPNLSSQAQSDQLEKNKNGGVKEQQFAEGLNLESAACQESGHVIETASSSSDSTAEKQKEEQQHKHEDQEGWKEVRTKRNKRGNRNYAYSNP